MSEDLQVSVRRKKAHEIRFVNIVITLSYYDVTWNFVNEALRYLSKGEIYDIVDERNALSKCGYVMCSKYYESHPTAVVSLDVSQKKIYNISRRKKFCSDWCYAAFKYMEHQLPDDATWKDGVKYSVSFDQYPLSGNGCKGDLWYEENAVTNELRTVPVSELSKPIHVADQQKKEKVVAANTLKVDNSKINKIQSVINSLDIIATNKKKNLTEVVERVKEKGAKKMDRKIMFVDEIPSNETKTNSVAREGGKDCLDKVLDSLTQWFTRETRNYLLSASGDGDYDNAEVIKSSELPPLDSHDQVVIRRSIVLRRIQSCATNILADFGVDDNSFHIQLIGLIQTCTLSSHNILFSAKELKCLIVVLIDVLQPKMAVPLPSNREDCLKKYGIGDVKYYEQIVATVMALLNRDELTDPVTSQGDI